MMGWVIPNVIFIGLSFHIFFLKIQKTTCFGSCPDFLLPENQNYTSFSSGYWLYFYLSEGKAEFWENLWN